MLIVSKVFSRSLILWKITCFQAELSRTFLSTDKSLVTESCKRARQLYNFFMRKNVVVALLTLFSYILLKKRPISVQFQQLIIGPINHTKCAQNYVMMLSLYFCGAAAFSKECRRCYQFMKSFCHYVQNERLSLLKTFKKGPRSRWGCEFRGRKNRRNQSKRNKSI